MERPCKHVAARAVLFALALAGLAVPAARAGLLPSTPSITAEGDKFRWTYSVFAPSGVEIHYGDAFTLIDLSRNADFIPGGDTTQPPGWFSGSWTPAFAHGPHHPPEIFPGDDPALWNKIWIYVGDTPIIPGPTGATLGDFSVLLWSDTAMPGQAGSKFHQSSDGRLVRDTTAAIVPVPKDPPPQAPEPATLAMLSAALPLLGAAILLRRRRRLADPHPQQGSMHTAVGRPGDAA